jgi:hypothetical protein
MKNPIIAESCSLKQRGIALTYYWRSRQRRLRLHQQGFALVATLLLMILLTVIAVGLLTLSSISLRTSQPGQYQAVARANARLAIMLALGDLQKFTGPDKRVTAQSSILPISPANDKWVGVWRTDGMKGEANSPGIIRKDTQSGTGYNDRRSSESGTYGVANQCLGWLVSGYNPDPNLPLAAGVSMEVRSGSAPIRVPKTVVATASKGAYGYYVSDESTKARLNLADPYVASQPDAASPSGNGMRRWLAPQSSDATVFFQGTPVNVEQASKVISRNQLMLSPVVGSMNQADFRTYSRQHDDEFTTSSRSVLADTLGGGLKGDLTAYLEGGTAPALGPVAEITDSTAINGALGATRTESGPKFGMLRNWYNLRTIVTGSGPNATIPDQLPNTFGQNQANPVDPGKAFVKPVIQPVMTEAVYYLNHVLDGNRVMELIYPRVVLWNPFSVKMKTSGHIVLFNFESPDTTCRYPYTNSLGQAANGSFGTSVKLGFYIPPTEFAAGEALTFCAPTGDRAYDTNNLRTNALSASNSPGDLGFFTRHLHTFPAPPNTVNTSSLTFTYNGTLWRFSPDEDKRNQTVSLHSLIGNTSAVTYANAKSSNGPPMVRMISLNTFSYGNNGRWMPTYTKSNIRTLSEVKSGNIPPDSLLAYGERFRFAYETYSNRVHGGPREPWYVALLAHHNINAPNIHRWPSDNIFGMVYGTVSGTSGARSHLYSYGIIAQARQWSPWLDPEVLPRRGPSGAYRTAVFSDASFATADSVYPVYDIPLPGTPLVSLGALQHVPLSPFTWHPTHAIGNSLPSPFVPLDNVTSNSLATENQQWTAKVSKLTKTYNTDVTGFNRFPKDQEVLINDLSFELNHALWDRYFLSAIPRSGAGWLGSRWNPTEALPNSRLTINSTVPQGDTQSELLDFHRAARSLWLEGGFNVNSTSVNAWKSLLRSFRSVSIPGDSQSTGDGAAFPGYLITQGTATTSALDATSDRFWRDYRKLSDGEIDQLAAVIVEQVKKRAPFLGVSDFVNRRLGTTTDPAKAESVYGGTLQVALDRSPAINEGSTSNPDLKLPDANLAASQFTYGAPASWAGSELTPIAQQYSVFQSRPGGPTRPEGQNSASQITQADILQQLGPVLVARGDTFVIRACGEAHDAAGKLTAKVWCEATVQRTPVPITPDPATNGLNPLVDATKPDWGRRYEIESFRWLSSTEI